MGKVSGRRRWVLCAWITSGAMAVLLLALVPWAGASTGAGTYVPGGTAVHHAVAADGRRLNASLEFDGAVRTYHLYVPSHLPKGPVPLLVGLHGGLGSGTQFESNTDFDGLAQANGFIAVYPDGTPTRLGSDRLVWNAGGCCGIADADYENVDDVGFVSALISHLESEYDIDPDRVFLTGHSNGALLAFGLACEESGVIDAIAVQSGALLEPTCRPTHPVSVLEIHGTDDQNIPINGGKGSRDVSGTTFPPPVDALKTFAAADHCGAPTTMTDPRNHAVSIETWKGCQGHALVEWAKVRGANHAWMGHPGSRATELLVGRPYLGFDSSLAVWSFLAAHPGH
jgi:polyhydroxybutyrate depolymerase